ncbi:hypothetical protein ACO0RG_003607 [Hanseniaspora osmophila]
MFNTNIFTNEKHVGNKLKTNTIKTSEDGACSKNTSRVLPKTRKKRHSIPTFDIQEELQQPRSLETQHIPQEEVVLEEQPIHSNLNQTFVSQNNTLLAQEDVFMKELISFPSLSTHSFSYNPLSPNSLFVRLIILKRTLEVMLHNPSLIKDPTETHVAKNKISDLKEEARPNMIVSRSTNDLYRSPGYQNFSPMRRKISQQLIQDPSATSKRNASSAAFDAYVKEPTSASSHSGNNSNRSSIIAPSVSSHNLSRVLSSQSGSEDEQELDFAQPIAPFLKRHYSAGLTSHGNGHNKLESLFAGSNVHNNAHIKTGLVKNDFSKGRDSITEENDENPDSINDYEDYNDLLSSYSSDSDNHSVATNLTRTPFDTHERKSSFYKLEDFQDSSEYLQTKTHDLQSLLDLLNETLENNVVDLPATENEKQVSNLHMMSVLNITKLLASSSSFQKESERSENLRKNLIDSLSQPFYELSHRAEQDYSQRILHDFTAGKNSSPQAILLCENENPWSFKNVNDIACLMFGIARNSFRALNLLDLIHKDSRNFVLNKLVVTELENDNLVFTGEIIGIAQPSVKEPVWTSLWARRKNGLIHFLFQKVPCDSIKCDFSLQHLKVDNFSADKAITFRVKTTYRDESETTEEGKNAIKKVKSVHDIEDLFEISNSISEFISNIKKTGYEDHEMNVAEIIKGINDTRYFTLNSLDYNIPCAVTAGYAFESDIKLNIHSMPYIAGAFIIDSSTSSYELISFNKSVSKNLFGIHAKNLMKKPIKTVLPRFNAIIEHIHRYYPEYNINKETNKSLVLTEHFFRKVNTELEVYANLITPQEYESKFYNSKGINGMHRDGSLIKLDVQLRVLNTKYALLWITHSRDIVSKNYNIMPSQMKILKENEMFLSHQHNEMDEGLVSNDTEYDRSIKEKLENVKNSGMSGGSSTTTLSEKNSRGPSAKSLTKLLTSLSGKRSDTTIFNERTVSGKENDDPDESQTHQQAEFLSDEESPVDIAKKYKQNKESFLKSSNFNFDRQLIISATSRPSSANTVEAISKVPEANGHVASYANLYKNVDGMETFKLGQLKHKKKYTDFTLLESMGRGAYGLVDLCMHKKLKYIIVLKRIIKERILFDTWVRDVRLGTVPSEIHIMALLNDSPHENIMYLLDFFEDDDFYYIETPIHGNTGSIDLFDLIEVKTDLKEIEVKLLFKQVVSGVKHLHALGIVHRDIKDENVIVDGNGCIKIIDFGAATHVAKGPFDTFVGTIDYAAPEVLSGEKYVGKPQDCWSLGVLLYTIVFKENPFYNIDEIMDAELKIPTGTNVSNECINLIKKILDKNVNQRPDINTIFNDPWLKL